MNDLHRILEQLQDTDAATAEFERLARDNPNDKVHAINVRAVRKRRVDLERRVNAELRSTQSDLVQYHVKRAEDEKYPVLAVADAIANFQELVTSVFDAIRTAPKQRYRPSPDSIALSTLDFGMALPVGSVVVSMSIPNERLIAVKSDLDRTFDDVFQILGTREPEALRALAQEVGIASIAKAHDWADSATKFGLSTQITVQKGLGEPFSYAITNTEAQVLKEIIEEKSDQHIEYEDVIGELLGIDIARPGTYFHLKTNDGRDLQGKLADDFPANREWAVHLSYSARLMQVTTIRYATGEERVDWLLAALRPIAEIEHK